MTIKWPDAWREILAWTIGGICILALALIATFPYSLLQNRIVTELKRATGLDIRIADWAIGLPLSLEWRNVSLSKPNLDPVEIAGLQAKLGAFQALTGSLGLDLFVQLNEQAARTNFVKGTLTAASFSLAGPLTVKGQLQQVDLPKIIRRYVTRGILTGEFSHRMDTDPASPNVLRSEGTWLAEATDLEIDQIPLANGKMLMLTFSKAAAGLSCRNLVCDVTQLRGEGMDGSFEGQGQITLQQQLPNSQLALTVTIIPGPGFASKAVTLGLPPFPSGTPITVKIVGTLAQARIAL
ncbi:MAG: type II secretion system protein GspN [Nitrospira sp.]|uniref:type II secretion system protein GspN n=1 Tax=Nitrospira sp. BLG_1 TaxID=3395883 RepID=UPI0039BC482B|nr:type II secretion system protein GspN [Nitrospira sp.]